MSRISDYFLSEGINQLGISHEVIDGKLTIEIRQNKFNINEDESYFKIGDDLFWIKEKKKLNNKTVYTVSHIVQHESNVSFDKYKSNKISDVFPGITDAESITVILK
jgi:hypothetical protein